MEKLSNGESDLKAFKDDETTKAYNDNRPEGEIVVELSQWLSKVTLDIIGISRSFHYGLMTNA